MILGAVGGVSALDPWLGFLAALLLLGAGAEVLFPSRFILADDGLQIDNLLRRVRRPWSRLSGWAEASEGYWVVGRGRSGFLRARRTVRLRCPGREAEVERALRHHLGAPAQERA